jgi:hypothetical protein
MSPSPDESLTCAMNSMDSNPVELQNTGILPDFSTVISAPHLDILPNGTSHISHTLPSMFPIKAEAATLLPASLHVPMPNLTVPVGGSSLDMHDSSAAISAAAPGFLSEFSPPAESFAMQGLVDNHLPVQSPPRVAPTSHPPSHLSSPTVHNLTPPFNIGTSSLASALNGMGVGRSPPESILSSGMTSSGSEQTMSSMGGKPSPESQNSGINVPLGSDGVNGEGGSPEATEIPHRMVVEDLFSR